MHLGTVLAAMVVFSASVFAQSLTTGDISGTVTDPTGAAIANASVTLKGVDSTFGQILTMAGTPTSPYGNFLGFDSSPRVLQVSGKITF